MPVLLDLQWPVRYEEDLQEMFHKESLQDVSLLLDILQVFAEELCSGYSSIQSSHLVSPRSKIETLRSGIESSKSF